MAEQSAIEWTDGTFNPWWGCSRVSPACAHCYADTFARRTGRSLWDDGGERRLFGEKHWDEPRKWNRTAWAKYGRPMRVFCASMADVFEDHPLLAPEREKLWALIEETPNLAWQLLTKRPENVLAMVPWPELPTNVWIGTSLENARWTFRADILRAIPARIRFLSCEPLLGSLFDERGARQALDLSGIHWIIAGGESGPKHRQMRVEWLRELRDACSAEAIPFFFKQWGGRRPKIGGKVLDAREWCEMPDEAGQLVLA